MKITAISRSPSLVEKVATRLAELTRGEDAEGGRRLPAVQALSEQLGVSRSVVREAVKRLETQGLLEVRQGVGMRSTDNLHKPLTQAVELLVPDAQERLRQLVQVRLMLEPEHARLAALNATPEQRTHLQEVYDRLATAETLKAAIEADMAFHHALAAASGNQVSAMMLLSLTDLLKASLSRGYSRVTTESAIVEHGIILQAVLARDAEAAETAMRRHLDTTLDELALPPKKRVARKRSTRN
ncbi:FadR/GntR family transcriptional regulator [Verrucomicrobium sp. BvORR106]|uniref:FadR/GntR family transcriptional regulator n=1 Tax=Verrucomicrobium sp. BvORR106 TaxID=1403819 RepID=UPI00068FBB25|nr:FadR/GntR family transcriptional regulator [Verrucomicrobium sp. BvORR106]